MTLFFYIDPAQNQTWDLWDSNTTKAGVSFDIHRSTSTRSGITTIPLFPVLHYRLLASVDKSFLL